MGHNYPAIISVAKHITGYIRNWSGSLSIYPELLTILLGCLFSNHLIAQDTTVGLIKMEKANSGYILFNPLNHNTTYLINRNGERVHSWESAYVPGMSAYLSDKGFLFRAGRVTDDTYINSGGAGGIIEKFNWDGDVVWQFRYSSPTVRQHHDFEILPNGNLLLLAWEKKTREEAVQAGRDPSAIGAGQLWPDHLIEVQPEGIQGGKIVWEWHVWDHLIQDFDPSKDHYGFVEDHPELINLNHYQNTIADWIHGNSLEYNQELDQIMFSSRGFDEVWIIDHSTTTAEARTGQGGKTGRGGDLIWRWGNPSAYNGGATQDQRLFGQHGLDWVCSEGQLESEVVIFNNGNGRSPSIYSTIETLLLSPDESGNYPVATNGLFLPDNFQHTFVPLDSLSIYAPLFSNAIRLNNEHLLLCIGPRGTFIEYDEMGMEIWKYINPVTETGRILNQGESIGNHQASINSVFAIDHYGEDFPGFAGKVLTPSGPIEGNLITTSAMPDIFINLYPNPTSGYLYLESSEPIQKLRIVSLSGISVYEQSNPGMLIHLNELPPGVYVCLINGRITKRITIVR